MRRKTTTVTELEQMTPAERDAHFEDSIVRDLTKIPPAYLDRIRAKFHDRIDHAEDPDRA
jgi:hypothetical protein